MASPRRLRGHQVTRPPAAPSAPHAPHSGGAHRHSQRVAVAWDRSRSRQAARSGVRKPECTDSRECQCSGHQWREDDDSGTMGHPHDIDPTTVDYSALYCDALCCHALDVKYEICA